MRVEKKQKIFRCSYVKTHNQKKSYDFNFRSLSSHPYLLCANTCYHHYALFMRRKKAKKKKCSLLMKKFIINNIYFKY